MSRVAPMRPVYQKSAFSEKDERAYAKTFKNADECWGCGKANDETIVGAHLNSVSMGSGTALKTRGAVAPLCGTCHDILDGRTGWGWSSPHADRQQIIYRIAQKALQAIAIAWRDR